MAKSRGATAKSYIRNGMYKLIYIDHQNNGDTEDLGFGATTLIRGSAPAEIHEDPAVGFRAT